MLDLDILTKIFVNNRPYQPYKVPVVKVVKVVSGGEISYTMEFANGESISHTDFIRLNKIFID